MKIRKGFVSNSSTTTYTCDVCGEEAAGRDISLSDWGMFQCINNHTVCEKHEIHVTGDMKKTMLLNYTDEWSNDKGETVRKEAKEIIDEDGDWEELFEETFEEYTYESPEERCPICQFKEISSDETIRYIFKKNNTTKEEVMAEMKKTFSNYKELKEYLKETKNEG